MKFSYWMPLLFAAVVLLAITGVLADPEFTTIPAQAVMFFVVMFALMLLLFFAIVYFAMKSVKLYAKIQK